MKDKLITAGVTLIRAVIPILRLLPPKLSTKIAAAAAGSLWRLFPRERQIAQSQLAYAIGGSEASRNSIFRGSFRHLGFTFAELINSDKLLPDPPAPNSPPLYRATQFISCINEANDPIVKCAQSGSPSLVLASHFGNFELQAAYYAHMGVPLYVIGRKPNYPAVSNFVDSLRKNHLLTTIWREDPASARKLVKALKTGGVIAVLIDQDIDLENGFSRFFGLEAASPIGPIRLAVKQKVPVFYSFTQRTAPLTNVMLAGPIEYNAALPLKEAVQQILDAYNVRLEELIRGNPEQWVWWHRRWRRRPEVDYRQEPQLLRSTKDYVSWISQQSLESVGQTTSV